MGIYDFILELYATCDGDFNRIVEENNITPEQLKEFLLYASTFLSNLGNYYVRIFV
jgi:dipeptidyl-peptidase-3